MADQKELASPKDLALISRAKQALNTADTTMLGEMNRANSLEFFNHPEVDMRLKIAQAQKILIDLETYKELAKQGA